MRRRPRRRSITGALIADELSKHDHDMIVLEPRDIGWGSTSASTALLQFEIDTHMIDLAGQFDDARARSVDGVRAARALTGGAGATSDRAWALTMGDGRQGFADLRDCRR